MSSIILYTTHCPKCRILEKKLTDKNIEYKTETDINKMLLLGFSTAPILEVNREIMDFASANIWINNYKQEN